MIARRLRPAQFQPVQRRLARHRRAVLAPGRQLAGQHRHQRIVAQFIVVVEVLVAERNAEHALADQSAHRVLDQLLAAVVAKAGRKSIHQTDRSVGRPSSSAPASDVIKPPSKAASTTRPPTVPKSNRSALHSVGIGALLDQPKVLLAKELSLIRSPDAPTL